MKTLNPFRLLTVLAALIALLLPGAQAVTAAPPAPVPVTPGEGATVATPTFSWQAADRKSVV